MNNARHNVRPSNLNVSNLLNNSVSENFLDIAFAGTHGMEALCHHLARHAGWWDEYYQMPEELRKHFIAGKLALVHSEISEGLEGFRKNLMDDHLPHRDSLEVELADAVIRIFDLAGARGLSVTRAILEKLNYNLQREDHKLEVRATQGGKSL